MIRLALATALFAVKAQAFVSLPVLESKPENMKLPLIESLAPGIKYDVIRERVDITPYTAHAFKIDPDDGYRIRVELKNVTVDQCNKLKNGLAKESLVDCSRPHAKLDLVQFTGAAIQATDGKTFPVRKIMLSRYVSFDSEGSIVWDPQGRQEEKDSSGNALVRVYRNETNCWGTAYEVARRSKDSLNVHVAEIEQMQKYFFDAANSEVIISDRKDREQLKSRLARVKFGDVLVIKFGKWTQHMATFVDRNLLFERKGNDAMYLNRLMPLDEILSLYDKELTVGVIRPKKAFAKITDVIKDWRLGFGPKSDDYEGEGSITYLDPISYEIKADRTNERYVLGEANSIAKTTILAVEAARADVATLTAVISSDLRMAKTLTAVQIAALAKEIVAEKELSAEQLLHRAITMKLDKLPVP